MKIPLIYLKDKQAFTKRKGVMHLLGNPVETAKKLKIDVEGRSVKEISEDILDKENTPANLTK